MDETMNEVFLQDWYLLTYLLGTPVTGIMQLAENKQVHTDYQLNI